MLVADLIKLVARVNAGLAVTTWPFIIYEVFSKSAPVADLRSGLDVRRGQLLNLVTERIQETLQPFWPKTPNIIVVQPDYRIEAAPVFSDDARDQVTECLKRSEALIVRASRINRLPKLILRLDRCTYWLVYGTAVQSVLWLLFWLFSNTMSVVLARTAIVSPVAMASAALIAAGIRQAYHHKAQREIVDEFTNQ